MSEKEKNYIIVEVKIIPKSKENKIVEYKDNILKIKIKALPEKGKANQELIRFLSKELKIPQREIEIIKGQTSKSKRLKIYGLSELKL